MPMRSLSSTLVLLAGLQLLHAGPKDWPGWRGPFSNGISELKGLPDVWSETENIAWKVALEGRGHSSPVLWGDRLFLTTDLEGEVIPGAAAVKHTLEGKDFVHPEATGATREHTLKLLCFDARTGKLLWDRVAYQGRVFDDVARFNTYASPTVITDGAHVYAYFESQGLYSYDFDGKLTWKTSFGGIATLGVGTGVSPVLAGDQVIVLADQDEGKSSFIAAVSTRDGKLAWKTPRTSALTWTTPLVVDASGRKQIIVPSTENVISYDASNGKPIWQVEGLDSNVVHTPVTGHGLVFVSAGYPKKKILAIRLDPSSGQDRIAWRYDKGTGYIPSPLLLGDSLYVITDGGIVSCLDARTGLPRYEGKRFKTPAKFLSPPVAFDGRILITSQDGDTHVVKAGPEFVVLRTNSLGESINASLALAGEAIFVRSEKHLFRISYK